MPNRRGAILWVSSHSYRCLSSGTAGNRTPRRVDGMNWQRPSPFPFVPFPRAVSRRGAASNITIYNLEAAGGIEPPKGGEKRQKTHIMAILINQSLPALTRRMCRCLTHSAAVCAASSEDKSDTSHMMELQNPISLRPRLSASRLSPPGAAANGGNSSECAGARPRCSQCASRPKHSHRQ